MTEEWKDIKNYEGLYQVSNWGRVKSLGNGKSNNSKEKILKPFKDAGGYLVVKLYKDGKTKCFKVHRLVAETFILNSDNFPCVNHKDENKKNNFVFLNEDGSVNKEKSNLEWCTYEYNNIYGTRIDRMSKAVLQFTKSGEFIREWESATECGRNGFAQSNVCACCRGKKPQYKGFKWKYK